MRDRFGDKVRSSPADKIHNANSILCDLRNKGDGAWSRFNGGRDGTLWYYRALVDAFRAHGDTPLVQELDRIVTGIEQLAGTNTRAKIWEQ